MTAHLLVSLQLVTGRELPRSNQVYIEARRKATLGNQQSALVRWLLRPGTGPSSSSDVAFGCFSFLPFTARLYHGRMYMYMCVCAYNQLPSTQPRGFSKKEEFNFFSLSLSLSRRCCFRLIRPSARLRVLLREAPSISLLFSLLLLFLPLSTPAYPSSLPCECVCCRSFLVAPSVRYFSSCPSRSFFYPTFSSILSTPTCRLVSSSQSPSSTQFILQNLYSSHLWLWSFENKLKEVQNWN